MSTSDRPPASGPPELFADGEPADIVLPVALTDKADGRAILAARYGRFWGLPLRLVHVATPDQPSGAGGSLDAAVADLRASHPDQVIVGEVVEANSVASGIRAAATDRSVVFLPSQRGTRWLDEQSVTVAVVQSFAGFVMVCGPECDNPPMGASVIVPLDGSGLAERAIEPAMAVAGASGAIVRLVTAMPAASIDTAGEMLLEGVTDSERRYLQRIASHHGGGPVDVRWQATSDGDPVAGIDAIAAEHGSSLVVAATHGASEREHDFFGSVCLGLVERGRIPVLIVTPGADSLGPPERGG